MDLSGVGVWSNQLRYGDSAQAAEAAAELEDLGFTALWIPDIGGPVLDSVAHLLASTTGGGDRDRHPQSLDARACRRGRRIRVVDRDARRAVPARHPVPVENRVLAALGPKMLELSATRARGAHPYLVTPDHTRQAREALGDGPLLLPEQAVLFAESRDEARAVGTDWLRTYTTLPNYANNLLRSGFTQDDLDTVSDRLFDAIIAWGGDDAIVRRIDEHKQAGADHVCVQVLTAEPLGFPREQWRRLAAALI
jgi:hypothetical protein